MKKIILSAAVAAAMLSTGSAFAGGGSLFGSSSKTSMEDSGGIYMGGSIGQASYRCTMSDDDCKNDGWKIFGGYKINQNMAVEAGYYNLGEEEADYDTDYGKMHATGKASGIGVAGVYSQPVADNLEVFGKLGAMFWTVEGEASQEVGGTKVSITDEEDGTSVLFGLGASYKFDDNWGIRGEWERYTAEYEDIDDGKDSEEDIDVLSVGATFSTY
uniref:Outer membrane protein OmpA-like transmembrane domain-containing protein n=1 Tax=uncultured Thiotrichaceae bacterium TaxID=298394 RepID=A0A6S6TTY6_9GAMM|nr:MAG: Unknown protein [uncultured Thiotrichaceae bacterium]